MKATLRTSKGLTIRVIENVKRCPKCKNTLTCGVVVSDSKNHALEDYSKNMKYYYCDNQECENCGLYEKTCPSKSPDGFLGIYSITYGDTEYCSYVYSHINNKPRAYKSFRTAHDAANRSCARHFTRLVKNGTMPSETQVQVNVKPYINGKLLDLDGNWRDVEL